LLAAGLALAILAGLIAAPAFALGRGRLAGPDFTLRLGSYHLIARTTEHPACMPLPDQCFIPRPTFRIPQTRYYTVWAGQITYGAPSGKAERFAKVRGSRILEMALAGEP